MGDSTQIQVIAQGTDWFAVNKPAGMSVHNDKGDDLVSAFREHDKLFLLNRLDAQVSGIVMLATSKPVASAIQRQFADRSVEKGYRAIAVAADPSAVEVPSDGLWKQPLTKKAENRRKPAGFGGRRVPCKTLWQVERVDGDRIYLILKPQTGRKHQLRRHAAIAGWPLLGDDRYGLEDAAADFRGRIALHAERLVFVDPETDQPVELHCPAPW
jgi:23S rRNA-/tRNA-specific pseudouridylate synthase